MFGGFAEDFDTGVKEVKEHPLDAEIDKYLSMAERMVHDIIRDPETIFTIRYHNKASQLYYSRRLQAGITRKFEDRLNKSGKLIDIIIKRNMDMGKYFPACICFSKFG